jgi:hypothetical protein
MVLNPNWQKRYRLQAVGCGMKAMPCAGHSSVPGSDGSIVDCVVVVVGVVVIVVVGEVVGVVVGGVVGVVVGGGVGVVVGVVVGGDVGVVVGGGVGVVVGVVVVGGLTVVPPISHLEFSFNTQVKSS